MYEYSDIDDDGTIPPPPRYTLSGGGLPPMITPGALTMRRPMTKEEKAMTPVQFIANRIKNSKPTYEDKILVIQAYTGSGKSTALPVLLYKDVVAPTENKSIIVTQPKVLTTQRLAIEQGESPHYPFLKLGENIGYLTGELKVPPSNKCSLVFATIGILLNNFTSNNDDIILHKYNIIQIDEVHERDLYLDTLLMYIKAFIKRNYKSPDCPVFMFTSATFDTDKYASYLEVGDENILSVSGVTFPITKTFLPTSSTNWMQSAVELVTEIHSRMNDKTGRDILIFVHGGPEIKALQGMLEKANEDMYRNKGIPPFYVTSATGDDVKQETLNIKIIYYDIDKVKLNDELHYHERGTIQAYRRVILSTNVAETGLSIPTLGYVIDNGFTKSNETYYPYGVSGLLTKPVSRASATQRMGRVGRLFEGDAFLLYTEDDFKAMQAQPYPNLFTGSLEGFLLNTISANEDFSIASLDLLDFPPIDSLRSAVEQNFAMGYITDDPKLELTFMGMIARKCIYVSPQVLRCVFAAINNNVAVQDILTLMAGMDTSVDKLAKRLNTDIYEMVTPFKYKKYKFLTMCEMIDMLCIFNAFSHNMKDPFAFCEQYKIRVDIITSFVETRLQFMEELFRLGIDPRYNSRYQLINATADTYVQQVKNIKKCLYEGFRFNILKRDPIEGNYRTRHNLPVQLKVYSRYPTLPRELLDQYMQAQSGRKMAPPTYLLAFTPRITSSFNQTYKYNIEVMRVSVLDGYVAIDDTLLD